MEWKLIETAPKDDGIILIARQGCIPDIWEYVHASYWSVSNWYLPFDSQRFEEGTPFLGEDEQPTHWAPLPKFY